MSLTGLLAREERTITIGALALVAGLAWSYTFFSSANVGHSMEMQMEWSFWYALFMFLMWWIMMTAMMLPSASPTVLLFAALKSTNGSSASNAGSTAAFMGGYLFVWALFSLIAVALQWLLQNADLLTGSLSLTSSAWAAGLLIGAGIYQFSSVKRACLSQCRSPAAMLARIWRPGNIGAFAMGMHHGLFCLGCCWFMMLLLFFGGVMSPYWIVGLAIYVAIEKLTPFGVPFSKTIGCGLILVGLAWMFLPYSF